MLVFLSLFLGVAPDVWASRLSLPADVASNPEGYWGRGFGCGQAAENYQISVEVPDLEAAAAKAETLAIAAGAPSRNSMHDGNSSHGDGRARRYRQIGYLLPAKAADKVAKKLMDVGELTNYQLNKQAGQKDGIEERVALLEKELSENKAALERMPAATHFLTSRLKSLKQTLSACEQGVSKASITLTLMEKSEK